MLVDGRNEVSLSAAPDGTGYLLLQTTILPSCGFAGPVSAKAMPTGSLRLVDTNVTDGTEQVTAVYRNPLGGFVEALITTQHASLELRWVDDSLNPIGAWHTALSWDQNNNWVLFVDQTGKALVLSMLSAPLSGSDPSNWVFTAQWMDKDGQVGPAFTPIAPLFSVRSQVTAFAGFGTIVPLAEGGFAMYRSAPDPTRGSTSPTGWYALYPSGQGTAAPVPSWLQAYPGSINLIGNQGIYGAIRRDAATCARTALLLTASGEICYSLPLEGSYDCAIADRVTSDGSFALQDGCLAKWWPGLLRSRASESLTAHLLSSVRRRLPAVARQQLSAK